MTVDVVDKLVTVLRARLTDYNSSSRRAANWIYEGYPREDLGKNNFPRISVTRVAENVRPAGMRDGTFTGISICDVDLWTWSRQMITVGSAKKEGKNLCKQLSQDVVEAFEDYWTTDFIGVYGSFSVDRVGEPVQLEGKQLWQLTMTVSFTYGEHNP